LTAVLAYIDFFSTPVQRVAVTIASNLCKRIPRDSFEMVVSSIPNISALMSYPDQKISETAYLCIARLIDSFASDEKYLTAVALDNGIMAQLLLILRTSATSLRYLFFVVCNSILSDNAFGFVVKALAQFTRCSPSLTRKLLEDDIASVLAAVLRSITARSAEQVLDILVLINELMPPMPRCMKLSIPFLMIFSWCIARRASHFAQRKV